MRHENNGACPKCREIFNLYPNFRAPLLLWFLNVQSVHPEAHISCAGRGRIAQEEAYHRGASRARYGFSAHNYNAAFDMFALIPGAASIYPKDWFINRIAPLIPTQSIEWYGTPGSSFYELPHFEERGWRELAKQGIIHLVGE